MLIPWTVKRRSVYLAVFLLVIFIIIGFIWLRIIKPTCVDNRQNQGEEGIDCGGPCESKCLGDIQELIVAWARILEVSSGEYEAVAMLQNPNLYLALPDFKYRFKVYDKNNVLISVKEGETFINPGETFPIFEIGFDAGERAPSKVFIEFDKDLRWERIEKEKIPLIVSKKQFSNEPFPRLSAVVENKVIDDAKDIYAVAILYDENKNAIGASATILDLVRGGSSEEIVFTWQHLFNQEPFSSEIFFRTEITH